MVERVARAGSHRPPQLARKCSHRSPQSARGSFLSLLLQKIIIVWLKPKFQRRKPLAHWFQNCLNFFDSFFHYKDIQTFVFGFFLTVHPYFWKQNYLVLKTNCFFNIKFRTVLIFLAASNHFKMTNKMMIIFLEYALLCPSIFEVFHTFWT